MKTIAHWFETLKAWWGVIVLVVGVLLAGGVWFAWRMPWVGTVAPKPVEGEYQLPELPYRYDALEPYIDAKTMEIHYTKHHQGYVNKLNLALRDYPEWYGTPVDELLKRLSEIPEAVRTTVRNQAGGVYNHSLFWLLMSPTGGGEPTGELKEAIDKTFESFKLFCDTFKEAALGVFGSGWAWLCVDDQGELTILQSDDQDNPVAQGFIPILGLDVWEHAYYLKYQNRRGEYIDSWWHVVNWDQVQQYYAAAMHKEAEK